MKKKLRVLGTKASFAGLETFERPAGTGLVHYSSDEVSALCPVTGQPDWYQVKISLWDGKYLLESKSLKLYLQGFRQRGFFCEALASEIQREVFSFVGGSVKVLVTQKARGGISIEAEAG